MSQIKWLAAVGAIAAAGFSAVVSATPAVAIPQSGYEQCYRDAREVCFSEYPAGGEPRIQCLMDAMDSCARQYPFG